MCLLNMEPCVIWQDLVRWSLQLELGVTSKMKACLYKLPYSHLLFRYFGVKITLVIT